AHETLDQNGIGLVKAWIQSLPGPKVLAPPIFSSKGGAQQREVNLRISHPDPEAAVHYTLDGSAPTLDDQVYREPIRILQSTTVRARAFRPGYTKSITVQETFVFAVEQASERATSH
ncbi:MAG TPA: chitobiase/beta-hexosaminidase C-terminal domain-containing protein, partial [Patescibacteria group bacterium]|nr:chitobiase/beta-hexosaminidase C-terminal domain-containing protein [Patescibacteria group bacterium]